MYQPKLVSWLSFLQCQQMLHQHTDKKLPTVVSISGYDQNFKSRWALKVPAVFHSLDLWMVRTAVSSAFWSNSPCSTWISTWFLQGSLHADNVSDMPVRWDMDWTPFSAPLDKESCWQATAERQHCVCPFEAQWALKEQHKQIWVQQQGPSHNYWRCNVPLIMIQTKEFFFTASSEGPSLVFTFLSVHMRHSQGLTNNGIVF